jgi:hypothetical protein
MAGITRTYITGNMKTGSSILNGNTHNCEAWRQGSSICDWQISRDVCPPHPPLSRKLNVGVFCQVSTPSVLCRCFQDGNMAACVADIIVTSVVLESNSSEIVRQT